MEEQPLGRASQAWRERGLCATAKIGNGSRIPASGLAAYPRLILGHDDASQNHLQFKQTAAVCSRDTCTV